MSWANEKVPCPCGGKYTKKNKVQHMSTKKHLKYLESIKLKEQDAEPECVEVITKERLEEDIELDFIDQTITKDDPEFVLLKAKTTKKQIKILENFKRRDIPAHLPEREKSRYVARVFDLYYRIKDSGQPYVYKPPNRDVIRQETIESYLDFYPDCRFEGFDPRKKNTNTSQTDLDPVGPEE